MSDILKEIGGYLEDASVIMSKRVVADVVDEIARLLRDAYHTWGEWPQETLARIDRALNKGGGDE